MGLVYQVGLSVSVGTLEAQKSGKNWDCWWMLLAEKRPKIHHKGLVQSSEMIQPFSFKLFNPQLLASFKRSKGSKVVWSYGPYLSTPANPPSASLASLACAFPPAQSPRTCAGWHGQHRRSRAPRGMWLLWLDILGDCWVWLGVIGDMAHAEWILVLDNDIGRNSWNLPWVGPMIEAKWLLCEAISLLVVPFVGV